MLVNENQPTHQQARSQSISPPTTPLPVSYPGSSNIFSQARMYVRYTKEDFDDIITTWGPCSTHELVKSSPFYTRTIINTDPGARHALPEKADDLERTVHAVHPIPRSYLREMGPNCLHILGERLEEARWEVVRDAEFGDRIKETLARIDDSLEFIFRVELPGSRLFSGRV